MKPDLEKMRRTSDSLLTSIFARTISFRLTPIIARTPLVPLQITFIGLLLGILAAWEATRPGWPHHLVAALLLEFSHILDCVDGELARLTNRGNPFAAAMDPITDRFKDMLIIFAAFTQSHQASIFGWNEHILFTVTFFTVGFWTLYMYIVDAYLNPIRKKTDSTVRKIYLGLYDLFVYGAIGFLLTGYFQYFNLYVLTLAIIGCGIQIMRLRKTIR